MLTEDMHGNKESEDQSIEAVIFDLDGLLIDSEPIWEKSYHKFLEIKKVKDNPEIHLKLIGRGLKDVVSIMKDVLGIEGEVDQLVDEYRKVFYELFFAKENILMPGAIEIVKKTKGKNLIVALTTGGHTKKMAEKILEKVNLLNYFDLIVSSDDVDNGKPAPDVYFFVIEKLGFLSSQCLAFEDSVNGVVSAKAAGLRVFGVNPSENMREELKEAGADEVFASLKEIQL